MLVEYSLIDGSRIVTYLEYLNHSICNGLPFCKDLNADLLSAKWLLARPASSSVQKIKPANEEQSVYQGVTVAAGTHIFASVEVDTAFCTRAATSPLPLYLACGASVVDAMLPAESGSIESPRNCGFSGFLFCGDSWRASDHRVVRQGCTLLLDSTREVCANLTFRFTGTVS